MYIHIIHCGSLWIKYRNWKRKKKEKPSQIRSLLAHQLNPFLFYVSLTTRLEGFLQILEQPSQDTWSHVLCVLSTDSQYSHTCPALSADTESSVPGVAILPHYLWDWEHPIPHLGEVALEKPEYIFACVPSTCHRGASVQQLTLRRPPQLNLFPTSLIGMWHFSFSGSTSRCDAHPMLCPALWTAPVVQDPVSGSVLWPFLAHQSQWFAQRGLPVTQSPGNHAQSFFQKLCQSCLQRYHTLRESRSLKLSENI